MENPEEILHSLEEFSKMKPKDIPGELEEYLVFVAKTGDPVYQWASIKSLFREKLINVITEFYESCPVMEIPPCPNVDIFNYDLMKNFILEKLEAFNSAPFTLQRICELLTTPRKEYNRIDKFMRALEKNILVVSTVEPGGRRSNENGDGIMNGIETEPPVPEPGAEINIEEMDETPSWSQEVSNHVSFEGSNSSEISNPNQECIISCTIVGNQPYVSIEPLSTDVITKETKLEESSENAEEKESVKPEEENIVDASEPDSVKESIVTEDASETQKSETTPEEKTETTEEKTDTKMEQEEPQAPSSESMQEDEPSTEAVSKEVSVEVGKPEEKSTENAEVVELKEVISEPVPEPMGIENISPETTTENPETLEVSTSVPDDVAEEKVTDVTEKTPEDKETTEEISSTEKAEALEETQEKSVDSPETVEEPKVAEQDTSKTEEKDRGDVKIDIETVTADSSTEDVADVSETPTEQVKKAEASISPEKEIEKIEIENVQVESMNVTESSSNEKSPDNEQKVTESASIEVDPLKLDDNTEQVTNEEVTSTDSIATKTETPQPEEKEESTPMEVDVAEEKPDVTEERPSKSETASDGPKEQNKTEPDQKSDS